MLVALFASLAARGDPLFASHDLLELTLTGPLVALNATRDKSRTFPSSVRVGEEGVPVPVRLSVRGNSRLDRTVCKFPPLRLNFRKSDVPGTLFAGQDKIKLATQCDPRSLKHQGYLLKEYLAYRAANEITPASFKVRLVRIHYAPDDGGDVSTHLAFFVEDQKRLAARLNLKLLSVPEISATRLDRQHMNQMSLFQLMIGNVDWAATSGGTGDCCHNFKLFEAQGGDVLAVPYDFDQTGLVNPVYARVNSKLRLTSITQRRYRGFCRNNTMLDANVALFQSRRDAILSLVDSVPELSGSQRSGGKRYLRRFFTLIDDKPRLGKMVTKWCTKSRMIAKEV